MVGEQEAGVALTVFVEPTKDLYTYNYSYQTETGLLLVLSFPYQIHKCKLSLMNSKYVRTN